MTDYTKRIEALRWCDADFIHECDNCLYVKYKNDKDDCMNRMLRDAADAIEALQTELAGSKDAIRILNYNIEQMREDRMKLIEKEMARLKWEMQDENISKFADGEWWKEAQDDKV